MAFKDLTRYLYDGAIKLEYKDKSHRYYAYPRKDWSLSVEDAGAWEKPLFPKGTTTLLGETLEKNGLLTWPLGMGFRELFGYYDFIGDDGKRHQGFSEDEGTLWVNGRLSPLTQDQALPVIESAHKNWTRRKKQGADIGSVVHEAIEAHIRGEEFSINDRYTEIIRETEGEKIPNARLVEVAKDVEMATLAFGQFVQWWGSGKIEPIQIEELVYSRQFNISGTFDGLLKVDGRTVLADFKSSNASKSKDAAMPEGINYQYFIQSAIYAMAWEEMGNPPVDDLLIVSCRKDGGFTTIFASDLGFTVDECVAWAKATIHCFSAMNKAKQHLVDHAKGGDDK